MLAPPAAPVTPVDDALQRAVLDRNIPGGIVLVRKGQDIAWFNAGQPIAPDTHVRVGSITKTFTAAVVLQLASEGRVDLDAPVQRYLPGLLHGDGIDGNAITVRHVLGHRSGLPEYLDDTAALPDATPAPAQLVGLALTHPAEFPAGTDVRYVNTNYVVAGMLIEAVTGRSAGEEITRRLIVPLGLRGTYLPAPGDTAIRAPFVPGFETVDGRRTDVTEQEPSLEYMAGSLIATNADIAEFITALLDGRVVPPAQMAEMMRVTTLPDTDGVIAYGLGLMSVKLPCDVTAWGHAGDVDGFHTLMAKPVQGPAVSITLTQSPETTVAADPRVDILAAALCHDPQ